MIICRRALTVSLGFLLCAAVPTSASSIVITGFVRAGVGTLVEIDTSNAASLSANGSIGTTSGSRFSEAHFSASAGPGHVGLELGGSAACFELTCGVEQTDGNFTVISSDVLFISGATDGYIRLQSQFNGSFAAPDVLAGSVFTTFQLFTSFSGVALLTLGGGNGGIYDGYKSNGHGNGGIYDGRGISTSPFGASSIGITYTVTSVFSGLAGNGQSRSWESDFSHTARLGGLEILDANGNPVVGAVVTSESGYDYTTSLPSSDVPEPASMLLVGTGLAVELRRRFTRT